MYAGSVNYASILDISETCDNIYIWMFLVTSKVSYF